MLGTTPAVLEGTTMANGFGYWRGLSGRRYLARAVPTDVAEEFRGAPVILTVLESDGRSRPVWVGLSGTSSFGRAVEAVARETTPQAHVHLLASTPLERWSVVRDLVAALDPARQSSSTVCSNNRSGRGVAA